MLYTTAERRLIEQYACSRYFDEAPLADRMRIDGGSVFDAIPKACCNCIDRLVRRIKWGDFPGLSRDVFLKIFWQRYARDPGFRKQRQTRK